MCLMKKMYVLDKLHYVMSYSSVWCEFSIEESTIYSTLNNIFQNRIIPKRVMY